MDETDKIEDQYTKIAKMVDDAREAVNAMVAGFKADGFTGPEARAIVAGFFASMVPKEEEA